MTETAKIAEALVAFQAALPVVHKGKTATVPLKAGGSYSYTYADLAAVAAAAMPLLSGHGLAFSAIPRRVDGDYELVGTLLHISGEALEGSLPIYGRTAQEIGSSITYNRRYLLGSMTGLITDDDDDGAAANATTRRTGAKREPKQPPANALNLAKQEVQKAWAEAHGGVWDADAMKRAFEEWAALPIADADVETLRKYAAHLRGE